MKRIMIVGQPGAGKSTLARAVAAHFDLPVIHVDQLHWMPGWQERPRAEKIAMAREIEQNDAWVFEGGLSATHETRLARAEMLIVLELPLWLRLWRIVKRRIWYWGRTRPDMAPDCPERMSWEFLKWIWDTRTSGVRYNRHLVRLAREAGKPVHILSSPRMVKKFLASLNASRQEKAHGISH